MLKGASHEIEFGQIWYQKKDLEKLELRGWVPMLSDARAHYNKHNSSFSAIFFPSNLTETSWKGAAKFCSALPKAGKNFRGFCYNVQGENYTWICAAKLIPGLGRALQNFAAPFQEVLADRGNKTIL